MRASPESGLPNSFWKLLFLAAFLALFCPLPVIAQKAQGNDASAPKYDPHTETKMKGTVEEVKLPPKGSEKEILHLLVKNGTEPVDVYLCPKSFLEEMGVGFSKGDEIAVTGSKVKQDGADLVLAREVVKGNDTLVLRDDKGNPVWNWQRKSARTRGPWGDGRAAATLSAKAHLRPGEPRLQDAQSNVASIFTQRLDGKRLTNRILFSA